MHGQNLSTVYEKIDKCMLPEEYLPDDYTGANAGTIQDICSKFDPHLCLAKVASWRPKMHS